MIVFATSDKDGTGRSVTSCNIAYRLSLSGHNVAYLDFDFGSPTAGALFAIDGLVRGAKRFEGLHSYLHGDVDQPRRYDVRAETNRKELRKSHAKSGKLVLFPGDEGGAEFRTVDVFVERCVELLTRLDSEFDVVLVDLSSGRSAAVQMALAATANPALRVRTTRWLVYHRWTDHHIIAAGGLVRGPHGLVEVNESYLRKELGPAYDPERDSLLNNIRYVRTAVPSLNSTERPAQRVWLKTQHENLKRLATIHGLGLSNVLGETPVEPVLQWREQIILDHDVMAKIANPETAAAFGELADKLMNVAVWEQI